MIETPFNFPPKQELKLKLKDMLEEEVDEKYYLSEKVLSKLKYNLSEKEEDEVGIDLNSKQSKFRDVASTIRARYDCGYENFTPGPTGVVVKNKGSELVRETEVANTLLARDYKGFGNQEMTAVKYGKNKETFIGKKYTEFEKENGYSPEMFNPYNKKEIKEVAPTQSAQCGSATSSATVLINTNLTKEKVYSDYSMKKIKSNIKDVNGCSNTITANPQRFTIDNATLINRDLRIRKLTPLEVWRLMGFDDSDFEKAEQVNSNAQLYKQAGNSIVVNVLEAIFKELL